MSDWSIRMVHIEGNGHKVLVDVGHENETFKRHTSWVTDSDLSVAELHLATGVASRKPQQEKENA